MRGSSRAASLRAWIQAPGAGGPSGPFNVSRIQTTTVAAIAANVDLADPPGNVLLPARSAGLTSDSVVNVSQLLTLDRSFITEHAGTLPPRLLRSVDEGLRTVLQL